MSAIFCECSGTLQNTGKPSSQKIITDGVKIAIVPLVADDGTRNSVSSTDTLDSTFFDGVFYNTDASKRWYMVGEFRNVTDERGDPTRETYSDGGSAITQQGVRTFTGWLVNYSSKYLEILESFACTEFGIYTIDECGDLTGSISSDGTKLYPIRVNNESWYPSLVKQSDTLAGKVQLTFEFSQLERDNKLRKIPDSEMSIDLLDYDGLIEVDVQNVTSITTTGFVLDLRIVYDTFLDVNDTVVTDWVTASFDLYNTSTASSIVITSVTETADGEYTFVIPAQSSTDVLRLRPSSAKTAEGFWLEELITIP